jgi:hypothetical protein
MSQQGKRLRRGDVVEVRPPEEILQTLEAEGALDHLPFMPEMLEFVGKRFRVTRRALTVCYSGPGGFRGFHTNDFVTLDGIRCSGAAHDGCQKACIIFWRESWLKKADTSTDPPPTDRRGMAQLRNLLKVSIDPKTYYCQATELPKVTHMLSRWGRMARYLSGLRFGNFNVVEMARHFATFLFWWTRRKLFGVYARGSGTSTPTECLNLKPGEWVEVKPMKSIIKTLDERGHNRGLYFSPDMRLWCGQRLRVKGRLDKMIVDGTGQMRQLRNTVYLEGSTCGCSYVGLGMAGCSRCEFTYWREIWLRRCDGRGDEELISPFGKLAMRTPSAVSTLRDAGAVP